MYMLRKHVYAGVSETRSLYRLQQTRSLYRLQQTLARSPDQLSPNPT